MSKSAASMAGVVELLDSPEATIKKFKSSVTDTGKEVKFDEKENLDLEDARFFLIACSAFTNYLIVKAQKAGLL